MNSLWEKIFASLLGAFIIYLIKRYFGKIKSFFSPSTLSPIHLSELSKFSEFFVPGGIRIYDTTEKEIALEDSARYRNSIDYFIRVILKDEVPFYFIEAPSGAGKTTFLVNLFLQYRKRSRWKTVPTLALGKMFDPLSDDMINTLISKEKSRNTVLLLDALDEFYAPKNISTTAEYYEAFEAKWQEFVAEKLPRFKKVIFTVREQFINLRSIERVKVPGNLGYKLGRKIVLLPFDGKMRNEYLNRRFAHLDANARDSIQWIADKLEDSKLEFVGLPIILNLLEFVWNGYTASKKETVNTQPFFSAYNIFNIIVDHWLESETRQKGFDSNDIVRLKHFCAQLAYQVTLRNKDFDNDVRNDEITAEDLANFEDDQRIIDLVLGLGDRSLLVKSTSVVIDEKGKRVLTDRFAFLHKSFLEFFLVLYADDHESDVPFHKYEFAYKIFICMRLWKLSRDLPAREKYDTDPDVVELNAWYKLLYSLTSNSELRSNLPELLTRVIFPGNRELEDIYRNINGFTVSSLASWDRKNQKNAALPADAIVYLSPFVRSIRLHDKAIQDEDLRCFHQTKRVKFLELTQGKFNGSGLAYFAGNRHELQTVQLDLDGLEDEHLAHFRGFTNIRGIYIVGQKLTGSGFSHFNSCTAAIVSLRLYGENISEHFLECFNCSGKLEDLRLSIFKLTHTGLRNFKSCARRLSTLHLVDNNLTDASLECFQGFAAIRDLDLSNNKLDGSCLKYFLESHNTLETIDLRGNKLSEQCLEVLTQFSFLRALNVADCSLPSKSSIKDRLRQKGVVVVTGYREEITCVTKGGFVVHRWPITND